MTLHQRRAGNDGAVDLTGDSRRRAATLLILMIVLGSVLVASAAVPVVAQWQRLATLVDAESIGVPAASAGCGPVVDDGVFASPHVGPRTSSPGIGRVAYRTVPPTSGPHFQAPSPMSRRFFTAQDQPPMEELVHNLEHGYVIVWYDATVAPDQLEQLRGLARGPRQSHRKYIVSPWDSTYGSLSGHPVALAVWGHHQLCQEASGEVIAQFRARFPVEAAPEPSGS